jgi:DNA-binding transcriptional ArsR family regulator
VGAGDAPAVPRAEREIELFAFAYRSYFPEFFFPPPTGGLSDFENELQRLRSLDEQLVRLEFAVPLIGSQAGRAVARDPAELETPQVQQWLQESAAALGDETLARQLLQDPRVLLERFIALLSSYWQDAFEREWERIEPDLAASVSEAGRVISEQGLYPLLRSLWPEVRPDAGAGRFWLDRPHDHEVEIGSGDLLVLAPSVYVWPHVRVNCDPPWPLGLVFPASSILRESRPRIPPAQLIGVLRALADDTRLRTLRLIAERPRTTQELAPLVGITEAALSKHLRTLAEAGLVERHRDGYYVLYRLVPDQVSALAPSLETFLDQPVPGN